MGSKSFSSVTDQVASNTSAPVINMSGLNVSQAGGGEKSSGQSGVSVNVSDMGAIESAFEFAQHGLELMLGDQASARKESSASLESLTASAKSIARGDSIEWQTVLMWGAGLVALYMLMKRGKK